MNLYLDDRRNDVWWFYWKLHEILMEIVFYSQVMECLKLEYEFKILIFWFNDT